MKTRTFSFPNGGHSVRKLRVELEMLGDTKVSLKHTISCDGEIEVWYEEDTAGVEASILLTAFKSLGTRFVCDIKNDELSIMFYTKQGD